MTCEQIDSSALALESERTAEQEFKRKIATSFPHMWRKRTETLCEESERTKATAEVLE